MSGLVSTLVIPTRPSGNRQACHTFVYLKKALGINHRNYIKKTTPRPTRGQDSSISVSRTDCASAIAKGCREKQTATHGHEAAADPRPVVRCSGLRNLTRFLSLQHNND